MAVNGELDRRDLFDLLRILQNVEPPIHSDELSRLEANAASAADPETDQTR